MDFQGYCAQVPQDPVSKDGAIVTDPRGRPMAKGVCL